MRIAGRIANNLDEISEALGCFPVCFEGKSTMVHLRKIMTGYVSGKPEDSLFEIPDFKALIEKK